MKYSTLFSLLLVATLLGCARDEDSRPHETGAHDEDELQGDGKRVTGPLPGLETVEAGPRELRVIVPAYGAIAPNAERTRDVSARFPGVVTRVAKSPGDRVTAGEALAYVESNDSLQVYAVKSPIAGTVLARHVNAGETVESATMFEVSDLTTLWAEVMVFPRDFPRVRPGQTVSVRSADGALSAAARVGHIAPVGTSGTQAVTVRVSVDNPDGAWRPGLNVTAGIVVAQRAVPVAIRATALQSLDGIRVVFVPEGTGFAPRPVETGDADDEFVEIRAGLAAGERYVAKDSFLVKAELGKAGAAHEH